MLLSAVKERRIKQLNAARILGISQSLKEILEIISGYYKCRAIA
jgi:hypothetical protein